MIELFAALILVTLVFVSVVVTALSSEKRNDVRERISKDLLTVEELEVLKKYAMMFGIYNDADDINTEQLLELGRKLESHLGTETVEEIVYVIKYSHRRTISLKSEGLQHRMSNMIKENKLIAIPSFVRLVSTETIGGDRDGEPNII